MTEPTSGRPDAIPADGDEQDPTPYEMFGGEPFFVALVARFYAGVAADLELRAMYPEEDLAPAEERLRLFLMQYWGGPGTYSAQRGHPRLRMRHVPYAIDFAARDRWLAAMRAAVTATVAEFGTPEVLARELWTYLDRAALSMVNTPG